MSEVDFLSIINITVHLGPDGTLSDEGRATLEAEMVEKLKLRNPRAVVSEIEASAHKLVKGTEGMSPAELDITIRLRALVQLIERVSRGLEGVPPAFLDVARRIDCLGGMSGPCVYHAGRVGQVIQSAWAMIESTRDLTEELVDMVRSRTRVDDDDTSTAPPPAPN